MPLEPVTRGLGELVGWEDTATRVTENSVALGRGKARVTERFAEIDQVGAPGSALSWSLDFFRAGATS
jgi:hypothetical protein